MAVLDLLKKQKKVKKIFEKHPCRELDLESKIHYLNGIALIMNEDDEISEDEKTYLGTLVNTFGLNEEQLEESVAFAQEPDEAMVFEMLQAFPDKKIKYSFLMDCMMVANADGTLCEKEKALIDQFFELYGLSSKEKDFLISFFEQLQQKKSDEIVELFKSDLEIDIEQFEYLFDYLNIVFKLEDNKTEKGRNDIASSKDEILTFKFIEPRFNLGKLQCEDFFSKPSILLEPVNNEQFCIFLNEMYKENKIKRDNEGNVVISGNDTLLLSSENEEIIFLEGDTFIPETGKEKSKIVYVTINAAISFIDWISQMHDCNYELTTFSGESKGFWTSRNMLNYGNSFMYASINYEFYKTRGNYFILDEKNTLKGDMLIWSADSNEDNKKATEGYYSERTSFRFMKCEKK